MRRTAIARFLGALSLTVAAAIALAPAATAQTDVTRGRITGVVRGASTRSSICRRASTR
jgi:hypothetical protein